MWRSSGLPWCFISQNGVEDSREFSHAGDDGDLGRLSCGTKMAVDSRERQVAADGDEHAHIEGAAHDGAAAGDAASAAPLAAVAVEGRDADQRRHLMAIERSEFRQFGDQRAGDLLADPWHGDEEVLLLAPGRGAAHGIVDVLFEFGELGLERHRMRSMPLTSRLVVS